MPRLQVLNGKRQGAVFDVPHGQPFVIGHRPNADISIDDPWVSWDHARLSWNQDGSCWIDDLGSTNGTYVNCVRVKRELLRHEDIVFLGKTHVIFLAPASELAPAPLGFDDPSSAGMAGGPPPVRGSSSAAFPGFAPSSSSAFPPLRAPSALGALASDEVPKDPFASTNTTPAWSSRPGAAAPAPAAKRKGDPFADSAIDPFQSGPEYTQPIQPPVQPGQTMSGLFPTAHPGPAPAPPPPPPARVDPARAKRAFADTNADEEGVGPSAAPPPKGRERLSLSDLQEPADEPPAHAPSGQEISRLLGNDYDDLDTILGDGRAMTPDPARVRAKSRIGPDLDQAAPSEMRTRPINTDAVNQILAEAEAETPLRGGATAGGARGSGGSGGTSGWSAPAPAPQAQPRPGTGPQPRPAAPPPQVDEPTSIQPPGQMDLGTLAFERSRLDYENRTLKAALQAAQERSPQQVKLAADALRDQEMARLARRVAEMERELVLARQEKDERQAELDRVTDEMIEKEDRIATLEDELRRLRGGRAPVDTLAQSDDEMRF